MAIVSAVVVVGLQIQSTRLKALDVDLAEQRIALLFRALNGAYEQYCSNITKPVITRSLLLSDEWVLFESQFTNPLGNDFVPALDWGTAVLSVSTEMPSTEATSLSNRFSTASYSGGTLTVVRRALPDLLMNESKLFKSMYETECL